MSGRPATLKVDIVTDADTRGITQAESRLSSFGSKAAKVGKIAALGLAAVGAGAIIVGKKLFEMGDRADDSNASIRQGAKTMGIFGNAVDDVSNRLIKYAEKTARQTGIDQNSIKATQAKLLTFGNLAASADKVGGNFDRATQAALDLAAKGFGSAEGNAASLGKALNDPVKGLTSLTKSGVTFTEAEKARIATLVESNRMGEAQATVLKAIETQVGGTAKAMSGGTDRMKVVISQLGEKIGLKLVPVIDKASAWLVDKFLPAATRLGKELGHKLGPTIRAVGAFITDKLVPAGMAFYRWFVEKIVPGIVKNVQPRIDGLRDAFHSVSDAVGDNEPQLRKIGNVLKVVAEFVANKVLPILGKLQGAGFKALGVVIGGVIDTIGLFVDGISWAIDKVKELIDLVGKIHFPDLPDLGSLNPFGAGGLTTIGTQLVGVSPSFDGRRGWSTAAAGGPGLVASLRSLTGRSGAATVVDARTYLAVQVDGSGIVDPAAIARSLEDVLRQHAARLGRPVLAGAPW